MSGVFGGGSGFVVKFDLTLLASLWVPLSDLLGVIRSCLRVSGCLTTRLSALLWCLACTSVPCDDRGSEVLGWNCFAAASDVPLSFLPAFCFHRLMTEQ